MDDDEFQYLEEDAERMGVSPPLPRVERREVDGVGGDRLGALVWGDSAPRLAFVHGAGLHAHAWDSVILGVGRPAVAIDLPGHGESRWRDAFDYTPESMADSVAAGIRATAESPVTLVGHSLGGLTSIVIAARNPDLVGALVVIDSVPRDLGASTRRAPVRDFLVGPESYPSRAAIVERAVANGFGRDIERLTRGVTINTRVREDGRVVFKHHLANPPEGMSFFSGRDLSGLWQYAESLRMPVLLVHATHGSLEASDVEAFRRHVPQTDSVEFDTGHNVHRDDPRGLADAIGAFIEAHEAASGRKSAEHGRS